MPKILKKQLSRNNRFATTLADVQFCWGGKAYFGYLRK
jgi:hypothetical protein